MSFDNEYFIEAGRRLSDFSKKGYYPDGTNGIDHNAGGSRMLFYNEVAAMFIMTNGFLSNCVAEDAEFYEKVGTFPYPACNDSGEVGIVAGGNVFSISSQCEYPEMAADFLYYLTNADFSQDYLSLIHISYDINVNVVLPLVMTDKLAQWGQENPEMFKKNLAEIPLGRYGDAQKDIGKVCVFLASYDAKSITGDTLFIQGGVGMKP